METSVKAAEVLVPPPTEDSEVEEAAPLAACASSSSPSPSSSSSSDFFDPMEEFSRRLEDIVSTYGSAASVLDKQGGVEAEMEKVKKEAKEDLTVNMETEVALITKSLNTLSSPEQKLEELVKKYAELAAQRRADEKKLCALQQRMSLLLDERQQLQAEGHSSITARSKLETLCRELQGYYSVLRDQTLKRCREEEEKRKDITGHFQTMLEEIQTQIEQHSSRNDKLHHENMNLTEKLESLMSQCEMREESLEKINQRRDLQQKLTEAKLQQANALLAEAEEKHKREKEYLLREAIEKTKKCFAMKEQELAMKKKLTLYAHKFDEFQETLAKSNEIYVRFKKEMDNMSEKMKKMEKESNLWKTRFENCNKALTDMIEERTEKSKEYDLFVLKIQKLERLCRALQEERVVLYEKIKDVRKTNSKISRTSAADDNTNPESAEKSAMLTPDDLQELQQIQEEDPVLTEDMSRLKEQQTKLKEFAAALLGTPSDNEEEDHGDLNPDEDVMASAFIQFTTKSKAKEGVVEDKWEKVEPEKEPEAEKVQTIISKEDEQPVKPDQEHPAELASTSEPEKVHISPPADTKPEATEAEIKPAAPVEVNKVPDEPVKVPEEAPVKVPDEPVKVPEEAPVKVPDEPVKVPEEAPVKVPDEPVKVPEEAPVKVPDEPVKVPEEAPVKVPDEPVKVPEEAPVKVPDEPVKVPEEAPVKVPDEPVKVPEEAPVKVPDEPVKVPEEPVKVPEEAPAKSEPEPCKNTPKSTPLSNAEPSKKQTAKKKKKRTPKSAS
ncbi:beta-taxilin-like isoform X2 [Cheilinus undulatus]|uniref:beta-taxilin-like isoform X2 n=1 Tax=Cheilinus undulatus TaxID=241271 RepID=UPI001BD508BF|nr:beta-taxilin-like isoform X2 [Cheilinus undulatus]